jgi:uncharacterized protein (DUF2164 family)|tara:strand:+ start:704 stop:910 length:207 start_codon:yes stop_codon:yes gene_type:complete
MAGKQKGRRGRHNYLTTEQKKELEQIAAEIEAEAIQMKLDYEQHPSDMSGSVVVFHENSELLEEEDNG